MAIAQSLLSIPSHLTLQNLSSLCLLALTTIILTSAIQAALSPLRSIPGPFLARFTRLWLLWHFWRGDFHKTNIELHNKYGTYQKQKQKQFFSIRS